MYLSTVYKDQKITEQVARNKIHNHVIVIFKRGTQLLFLHYFTQNPIIFFQQAGKFREHNRWQKTPTPCEVRLLDVYRGC